MTKNSRNPNNSTINLVFHSFLVGGNGFIYIYIYIYICMCVCVCVCVCAHVLHTNFILCLFFSTILDIFLGGGGTDLQHICFVCSSPFLFGVFPAPIFV